MVASNPGADDWSITFDQGLKHAVLRSPSTQYDVAVVDVNKDERFFALQKDPDTRMLEAVSPITTKLTVENTLTKSSIMSFAEKTDTQRLKGIQSSKISDDVRGKKSAQKDQKSAFRASSTFTKSIRRAPATEPTAPASSATPSSSVTPVTSSSTPPNETGANLTPPSNGVTETKKEFKFKLPMKRKTESTDSTEQPQKKHKGEDVQSGNNISHNNHNTFGFLSKFSELSQKIHFVDSDRDRPPRRHPATTLEQFDSYQHEYTEKYHQYEQLFHALDQNKSDWTELAHAYNARADKKDVEATIQEVFSHRKELVDRLRRRYTYLHDELRDINDCLNDYIKNWANPQ